MHYDLTDTNERLQEALYPPVKREVPPKKTAKEKEAVKRPLLYALFSALLTMIAVFGLFVGVFFRGAPLGQIVAGGEPILRGSLFGLIVEVVRGSVKAPQAGLPLLLYALVFVLAAAILFSLAFTAAAFLSPKHARTFCFAGAYPVTLIYGALFLVTLLAGALGADRWEIALFDLPTLLIFLLLSAALILSALVRRRGRAVANALFFLLSLCSVPALCYPGTPLVKNISLVLTGGIAGAAKLSLCLLLAVTAGNIVLSVIRLHAKSSCLWDMLRFGIQLVAAGALLFTGLAEGGIAEFFFAQPLPTLLLFVPPLSSVLIASFTASAKRSEMQEEAPGNAAKPTEKAAKPSEKAPLMNPAQ